MGIRKNNNGKGFLPQEIIFSPSSECNLNCAHCFVSKNNGQTLSADEAISFLKSCLKEASCEIKKVGFSGGEPFLSVPFMKKVIAFAKENDFLFDRIMTNGVWWKTKAELSSALHEIQDAGFDGKIGLSLDNFHANVTEKVAQFCKEVFDVFNDGFIIEIQSVVPPTKASRSFKENILMPFANMLDLKVKIKAKIKKGQGFASLASEDIFIPFIVSPQAFNSIDRRAWESKKWFFDDFCTSLGQILYVHPNGSIAPCCGFANEKSKLTIGNIRQSYSEVIKQAKENQMINLCFKEGLSSCLKKMLKNGKQFPFSGRTDDICAFCSFVMSL